MKPDEMRKHIKQIPGLSKFPIRDHDHLSELLGGKDKEFKFKEKKLTAADVMRMFPANYFPVESEDDLVAKAAKLAEIGEKGFQPATGTRPDKETGPPDIPKDDKFRKDECAGYRK
jgi:hypothetical protein